MSARHLLTPLALVALVGLAVQPALADDQRPGAGDRRRGTAIQRSAPRDSGRPAPQARGESRGSDARGRSGYAAPRDRYRDDDRRNDARAWGPRNDGSRGYDARRDGSRAWGSRGSYDYRRDDRRTVVVVPRTYGRSYAVPRRYGYYPPSFRSWIRSDYYYNRPYYAFRPRVSIGFGVWLGHPVGLPSWGYAPFPVYGYPSGGYVNVLPSRVSYGGVSFEITPYHADLYVDGELIGQVGDFTPNRPPLTLAPGVHQVEVVAEGYVPLVFEVTVVPGQVLPYRGDLQPY